MERSTCQGTGAGCVCVQIDGRTQIPRVTLQCSQSNKCCSLNNSGLELHHGLGCWENTTHKDMILEQEVMIPDGGTIEKGEMMDNEKEPLFRSWACWRRWLRDAPLVDYFQEKSLVFASVIAHFPPTPGLWFPRWSTITASLTALVMFGFQLHLQRAEFLCTH